MKDRRERKTVRITMSLPLSVSASLLLFPLLLCLILLFDRLLGFVLAAKQKFFSGRSVFVGSFALSYEVLVKLPQTTHSVYMRRGKNVFSPL